MQYVGGKHYEAPHIVAAMPTGLPYSEPFVGAASVVSRVKSPIRFASDTNVALIHMWQALQGGWEPPDSVSEAEYQAAKSLPDEDPLKAFIRIGCSYAGVGRGYARGRDGRNYARGAKNSLIKKLKSLGDVRFYVSDYRSAEYPERGVVYLDPPYAGTEGYKAGGHFDSAEFWAFAQSLTTNERYVYVSSYEAPDGWRSVWTKGYKTGLRNNIGVQHDIVEHLWVWGDGAS